MSIFVLLPSLFTVGIMGCHGNHEISKPQRTFIFEDNIFLHLSGPIGQIHDHNEMSCVQFRSDYPVAYYGLPMVFSLIFKISLIFMNMQMR